MRASGRAAVVAPGVGARGGCRRKPQRQRIIRHEVLEGRLALAAEVGHLFAEVDADGETVSLPREWTKDASLSVPEEPTSHVGKVTREIVPGEVLLAFDGDAQVSFIEEQLRHSLPLARVDLGGVLAIDHLLTFTTENSDTHTLVSLQLGEFQDVQVAREVLAELSGVRWAQPNYRYSGAIKKLTPNDPSYGSQYHHTLMQNNLAWDTTLGSVSVIVAITDDGVQLNHPDLQQNLWVNVDEIAGNGIDDDANGFIDDRNGWDFVSNDGNPSPSTTADDHGTHVSGIVSARINNGTGTAGTAANVSIMPIRWAGSDGGFTSSIIANSFRYATDNGAKIVNSSYEADFFAADSVVMAGFQYMYTGGVLHFNAGDNEAIKDAPNQAVHQTLLVASSNSADRLSSFSNYGIGTDITAPGQSILSTVTGSGYATYSGTSMAAPNAAAVAALIWSAFPTLTREQVAARLIGTATNINAQNPGLAGLLGGGRANSFNAIPAATMPVLAAPKISQLREVPNATNPPIFPISRIRVAPDKLLDRTSVETAANWSLVNAGADSLFGTADDVPVTLTRTRPYLVGSNDIFFTFPTLAAGSYRFRAISGGLRDPFNTALDGDGNGAAGGDYVKDFQVVAGSIAFEADFSGATGTPNNEGFTPTGTWHLSTGRGNQAGHSADDSYYVGAGEGPNGGGTHASNLNASLTSPLINLAGITGQIALEFNHFLASEPPYDFAYVYVIDGANTIELAKSGSTLAHTQVGFEPVSLDLSAFAGKSIRIRFTFTSDSSYNEEGWYVDDVTVRYLDFPSAGGQVWNDLNGNRVREAGENGLAGWTVYLDQNNNASLDANLVTNHPSADVPKPIVDLGVVRSNISITGMANLTDVNVTINLNHTYVDDLDIYLVSPTGTRIALATDVGGSGDNFINTVFDQSAATLITSGIAPFTGTYRPEGSLTVLNGTSPNGLWQLEITDQAGGDEGVLNSWSLQFTTSEVSQTTTATGDFLFAGLPPAAYTVREVMQATWTQVLPLTGAHLVALTMGTSVSSLDFANTQAPPTFQVTTVTPTPTGVVLDFNRNLDTSQLNLYDVEGSPLGGKDLTLIGQSTGEIRGSLVVDPNLRRTTFVSTTGTLTPGSYTLTLRSAVNGFRDTSLDLLDGDANGTPGGDFVQTLVIAMPDPNARTVFFDNFARGPDQPVNINASSTTGVPLALDVASGVTSVNLELRYNPALLTISAVSVPTLGLPVGATASLNASAPGVAVIQFNSPTPVSGGAKNFVHLHASVPPTATYRHKHVLDLANISINGGTIPAIDDDAIHVVTYFGDASGNGTYGSSDAARVARVAVALDPGFAQFRLLDPIIVADLSGNNAISSSDTSRVLQVAVGLTVPNVPPLPSPAASILQGGPDPKLSIPTNLLASVGGSLQIPVNIDSIVDLTGTGLDAADLVLYYDPAVLDISAVELGSLLIGAPGEWLLASRIDPLAGRIFISVASTTPLEGLFQGELLQLRASIRADAPLGATAVNLAASSREPSRFTQLNDGYLTLIPAPTDAANDAGVDGIVTVVPQVTSARVDRAARELAILQFVAEWRERSLTQANVDAFLSAIRPRRR